MCGLGLDDFLRGLCYPQRRSYARTCRIIQCHGIEHGDKSILNRRKNGMSILRFFILFILVFLTTHCTENKKIIGKKECIRVDETSYYIEDKKVSLCELCDDVKKNRIEISVDNETPLCLIDSLINHYNVICICGDARISLNSRAPWPIKEVIGDGWRSFLECDNDNDIFVRTRSEEVILDLCNRYIEDIDQVKTIIYIRNSIMYVNGGIVNDNTKIEDPIKIRLYNDNTFSDLSFVYGFLMKRYSITQNDELYKNVRICYCFDIDELFYEKAVEWMARHESGN